MSKIVIIVYATGIIMLLIFSYAFIDPNLIYMKPLFTSFAFQKRTLTTIIYMLLLIILTTLYVSLIKQFALKHLNHRTLIKLISITVLILFFSYPAMLSYDIFNYIATAKVTYLYKENPYIIMPVEFIGDPLLQFMHAPNKTALYGPVWIALTAVPFVFGLNNFLVTLFLFKLVPLIFYVYTLFLIYELRKSWYSILLFALNPLVVVETIVSGHNDIVMVGLALSALLFLKKKKLILGILALLLSIGIKFATIFLIPVFIYAMILSLQKKEINWEKVYLWSFFSMFFIFLLSPIREEMYSWYALWFLVFICLIPSHKTLQITAILLSLGLMMRYTPFMYVGAYTPMVILMRTILTVIPLAVYFFLKVILVKFKRFSLL
jgi:hypothetical protein